MNAIVLKNGNKETALLAHRTRSHLLPNLIVLLEGSMQITVQYILFDIRDCGYEMYVHEFQIFSIFQGEIEFIEINVQVLYYRKSLQKTLTPHVKQPFALFLQRPLKTSYVEITSSVGLIHLPLDFEYQS